MPLRPSRAIIFFPNRFQTFFLILLLLVYTLRPTETYLFATQVYGRLSLRIAVILGYWVFIVVIVALGVCCLLNNLDLVRNHCDR